MIDNEGVVFQYNAVQYRHETYHKFAHKIKEKERKKKKENLFAWPQRTRRSPRKNLHKVEELSTLRHSHYMKYEQILEQIRICALSDEHGV